MVNVLAIGAHPDDMESLCFGTLAKIVKRGHKVTTASMVSGALGSVEMSLEETSRTRLKEAKEAASIIGATYKCIGANENGVYPTEDVVLKVVDGIRDSKADVIFTHSPTDYHPDHVNTSIAVVGAAFMAGVPKLETKFPDYTPSRVYYCDNIYSLDFDPDLWVDITETIDLKVAALTAHKSQVSWVKYHHNMDLVEGMKAACRTRGLQAGCQYAEVFKQVRKHMQLRPIDLPPL